MTWTACELTFKEKEDDARVEVLNGAQKYRETRAREKPRCEEGSWKITRHWEREGHRLRPNFVHI